MISAPFHNHFIMAICTLSNIISLLRILVVIPWWFEILVFYTHFRLLQRFFIACPYIPPQKLTCIHTLQSNQWALPANKAVIIKITLLNCRHRSSSSWQHFNITFFCLLVNNTVIASQSPAEAAVTAADIKRKLNYQTIFFLDGSSKWSSWSSW